ncbi:phosphate ABC transporter permease PstA [Marinagarivorans cellulosilyticus]|uniref:Phosphate transport system permease protein PstA n=1 Tax=Marinagarivorans cellulosilyticus TaxID=2721545 RepID=A0AAN1WGQ7_9GAMM|nr:phosphate ABC transporter permease PstA [Marinagarivorans cellulosilyticus]BCD97274.1 phosphate transport system permease protein [Marinagarivorans cellulosilyticus]
MTKPSSTKQAELVQKSLAKRYAAEKRFKAFGIASISFGLGALLVLFVEIFGGGMGGFRQTEMALEIEFDADTLEVYDATNPDEILAGNYSGLIKAALKKRFPDVTNRREKRALYSMVSVGANYQLRDLLATDPDLLNSTQRLWVLADDDIDTYYKSLSGEPYAERMTEQQLKWVQSFVDSGDIKTVFNTRFFTDGDSSEPEMAGIRGAVLGSLLTLLVTLALSFPVGVAAAIYLEEYAPSNRLTDFVEVNINNLAAVPSIIFGLLGLAIFINVFEMPRSIPLVGGMVLTLMTLPTIIISSRAAIKAVPPSIREAALGIGASKMQMILHHVLPLAMPGMLTGAIIGMAQALGETAPLLMIGMVAFIMDIPGSVTDPATVMPVQIFLWSDSPERAFVEKTSAAIMVLLMFLMFMNALAVLLRKRLERRW